MNLPIRPLPPLPSVPSFPSSISPQGDRARPGAAAVRSAGAWLLAALTSWCMAALAQSPEAPSSAPSAARARFDVFEYRVEGNTVLGAERIERAIYPFMGEGRTIDDVEGARAALEQAYRDAGFGTVLVEIPQQKVQDAIVVLAVLEGRVARLRVVGANYYSQERILAAVPALAEGGVPNLPDAQRQLGQVNSTADKRVTPLLRPGKAAGTTEVDLQVEDSLPLHGNLELNNHATPNTTATRLAAGISYANLFQREHSFGIQVQTSPQDTSQVKVLVANYTIPAGGGFLIANYVRSDSSSFVGGGVGVFGKAHIVGLRYLLPMPGETPTGAGAARSSGLLSLGLDYKDVQQDVSLQDGGSVSAPIRYAPFTVSYTHQRSADGAGEGNGTEFGTGLVFALRGLASSDQQFADKRYKALGNFVILKAHVAQTLALPNRLQLYAKLEGQTASQPLISNEQYVAGGVDSVRGYLEASQAADVALRGSLELRSWNLVPDGARIDFLQGRVFFDAAQLRLRSPLPGTSDSFQLASVGTGLTLRAKPGISARADLAWPLHDTNFQKAYDPRLQANVSYEF
jgi:hemolysin activation/secretion protein